jgi:hypothetical protein
MSDRADGAQRCQGCAGAAPALSRDGYCLICDEVRVRMDAALGAAMIEFADRAVSIALDYLHPDDVRTVVEDQIGWRADLARDRGAVPDWPRPNDERSQLWRELVTLRIEACGGAALPPPTDFGDL